MKTEKPLYPESLTLKNKKTTKLYYRCVLNISAWICGTQGRRERRVTLQDFKSDTCCCNWIRLHVYFRPVRHCSILRAEDSNQTWRCSGFQCQFAARIWRLFFCFQFYGTTGWLKQNQVLLMECVSYSKF